MLLISLALAGPFCGDALNLPAGGIAVLLDGATVAWQGTAYTCDEAVCEVTVPESITTFDTTGSVSIDLSCADQTSLLLECAFGTCQTASVSRTAQVLPPPVDDIRSLVTRARAVLEGCVDVPCPSDFADTVAVLSTVSVLLPTHVQPTFTGDVYWYAANTLAIGLDCAQTGIAPDFGEPCALVIPALDLRLSPGRPQAWLDADPTWLDDVEIGGHLISTGANASMQTYRRRSSVASSMPRALSAVGPLGVDVQR